MRNLIADATAIAENAAQADGLMLDVGFDDVFDACTNDAGLVEHFRQSAAHCQLAVEDLDTPLRFSEDFGAYGDHARSAMFFLGAGVDHPALHNPDYDFPDALIESGTSMFLSTIDRLLGQNAA